MMGRASWDHPRSRGVYRVRARFRRVHEGSSPLARGLPVFYSDVNSNARIIPARAGFTLFSGDRIAQIADHPRSRGVYQPTRWRPISQNGSSPLARGLLMTHHLSWKQEGIIPARAGFTL